MLYVILISGAEAWILNKDITKRLAALERKFLEESFGELT
jgi:hypothetical protein